LFVSAIHIFMYIWPCNVVFDIYFAVFVVSLDFSNPSICIKQRHHLLLLGSIPPPPTHRAFTPPPHPPTPHPLCVTDAEPRHAGASADRDA
jgi:hypothetical protein